MAAFAGIALALLPGDSSLDGAQASPGLATPQGEARSLEDQLKDAWVIDCGPDEKPGALEYVDITRVDGCSDEYVAIIDWQKQWWGIWCYFRAENGLIIEVVWGGQTEQSVHQIAGFRDERFEGVLVAVHGMTHMGNGSYYLHQIHEGAVHELIETRAVDAHLGGDGCVLGGEVLWPLWADFDLDGFNDLILQGVQLQIEDPDKGGGYRNVAWVPAPPLSIRKVFLWKPSTRIFERFTDADMGWQE